MCVYNTNQLFKTPKSRLKTFGARTNTGSVETGFIRKHSFWVLTEKKITRFFSKYILRNIATVQSRWDAAMPAALLLTYWYGQYYFFIDICRTHFLSRVIFLSYERYVCFQVKYLYNARRRTISRKVKKHINVATVYRGRMYLLVRSTRRLQWTTRESLPFSYVFSPLGYRRKRISKEDL